MEACFELTDEIKPSFSTIENWAARALACLTQKRFAGFISLSDVARFEQPWNDTECRKAEAKLDADGVLAGVSDVERALYRNLFGRVRRLKELIAKIEGGSPADDKQNDLRAQQRAALSETVLHWPVVGRDFKREDDVLRDVLFGSPEQHQRRDAQVTDLVNRSLTAMKEHPNTFPLYALQTEGAGSLETEEQFVEACEMLHQRHVPHPLKSFREIKTKWLQLIRFANQEEMSLSSDVAVYDCLQRFSTVAQSLVVTLIGSAVLTVRIINRGKTDVRVCAIRMYKLTGEKENEVGRDGNALMPKLASPCILASEERKTFRTVIRTESLWVYGGNAYFAEVELENGNRVRSQPLHVSVAPEELLAAYKEHNTLQAIERLETHMGQRTEIGGKVIAVTLPTPNRLLLNLKTADGHFVGCQFDTHWKEMLRDSVKVGDPVAVVGIVASHQDGKHLMLSECELILPS